MYVTTCIIFATILQVVHIDKVRLSNEQVAQLGVDVCRGLQYLHSINVMHRYGGEYLPTSSLLHVSYIYCLPPSLPPSTPPEI